MANFSANPVAGCSPVIVNFQDLSTNNPTSWLWNFGNGNTSVLQNPIATYFNPGTYTVTLTATNASGSNTITRTQYITVYEQPTVNFSANVLSGCFPLRVQFTDLSTPGAGNTNVSWLWDLGNGTTSTQQNPSVTYTTAGSFTITLRVTNDKGCTRVISRPAYITTTPGVQAGFTHTQPTVCRAPAVINFTNTSTGPPTLSYLWDFGDGNTSTATSPSHTYLTNGSFTVTLVTSSTAGCVDTFRSNPIVIGNFTTSFTGPSTICVNSPAVFTNTSSPAPVSTAWTFGDGGTANTLNATHTYLTPGVYNVRMINTYSTCVDSLILPITVAPQPVADFTAPVTTRCEPDLTVNFQDLSTGTVTGWEWDFGDGSPVSNLQNPSHTYTTYGSFNVRLIVTSSNGCRDTLVRNNFVQVRRAQISIPQLPERGCVPYTTTFNPVITSLDVVTSYQWAFGDGGTSALPNPTYTYTTQGTYNVRLIITTSGGCTDTLIVPNAIRVGNKPTTDFGAVPNPVCGRQTVYFTDLTTPGADEWYWSFGDGGTSTLANPTHNYNDTGLFHVQLISVNNGCPDTLLRNNYIRVWPPIARFTPVPNCTNRLQFSFTDQSLGALAWEWDFGDASPVSNVQNPVHTFPALGNYTVRLIVTNGGCRDTLTQTIRTVDENPDFIAPSTTACKIAVIAFTATNIATANIASYNWDFGDGGSVTANTPNAWHTYMNSGTYTVRLITTDINGCRDTIIKTNYIRINGPVANFSASNTAGCFGLTTTFTDLSTTDGVNALTNWTWNYGDGNIVSLSGPPYQHTFNTPGTFSVKLIVTDAAGCRDSVTRTNLVTATDPMPDFVSPDTLSCPGANVRFTNLTSPAGYTSTWEFGDGNTSTAASPTHSYINPGLYTVKLRVVDNFGCPDSIIKTSYIRVDTPMADFTLSDSVSSCTPLEVQFTNNSTYFTSVLWDFGPGEGTSNSLNPVHYYNTPGVYPVKLIVTSPGGCLDSIIRTVRVYDTTGSKIQYIPVTGCTPLSVSMSAATTGQISTYLWDFGDGNILSTPNASITHVYTNFGNFIPKVIMQDPSGCLIPLEGIDTLFIIGAHARFGFDTTVLCDAGTIQFTDSTTSNDPVTSYQWTFGDGGSSVLQNPSHYYSSPGLYDVQLAVQTQNGCRDTLTRSALIAIVQRPLVDIGGDTAVCINGSLTHSGLFLQPDTSVVTWQWSFPNGQTSTAQNPGAQTYTTAGTFTVTAIATNSTGCKDTTRQNILIHPLPVVTMPSVMTIQGGFPQTIPATYSPNTVSWQWTPSTGLSCTTCPNPEANPKMDSWYQVFFTDANGCRNRGDIAVRVTCVNTNVFIPNTFSPNGDGSNDVFFPRGRGLERVKLLRIFNRWGEVVYERRDFPVNDASFGWNGVYKNRPPQADVYVYQAELFCDNGELIRINGNIALVL